VVVPPLTLVIGCLAAAATAAGGVVAISLSHGFATIPPLWWGYCFGLVWFSKISWTKIFALCSLVF